MPQTIHRTVLYRAAFYRTALWASAALLSIAALPCIACGESPLASAAKLIARGDQQAEEKQYREALVLYKQAYELILPELRERPFLREVKPRIMRRSELQKYMAVEFAKEMTADDLLFLDRTVKLFGLAPPALDLKEMMLALFTEQVAGFYNSESKEMFLITEEPKKAPGFLERLLGSGKEFDSDEQKVTLSHEMAHALADQHFQLSIMDAAMRDNEDASLALSALVEGEATMVMLGEMMRDGGGSAKDALRQSPATVDRMFRMMRLASAVGSGKAMRAAPPFFRQSLIFPYHQGTVFVAHLTNQDGWKSVDRAFRFPPVSTEQILHPEKYRGADHDPPTRIELPDLKAELPKWKKLGEDTLGEYQTRLLLSGQFDYLKASSGWDGDRYVVMQRPKNRGGESSETTGPEPVDPVARINDSALLWATTWDSTEDAKEFAAAFHRDAYVRLKVEGKPEPGVLENLTEPLSLKGGLRTHWIVHHGKNVAIVEGIDDDNLATRLLAKLLKAKQSPWTYHLPPVETQ